MYFFLQPEGVPEGGGRILNWPVPRGGRILNLIDSELASPVGDKFKTIFSRIPYTKRATPRHRIVLLRRFGKQQECLHNRFSFLKYREKQLAQVAQERHSHSLVPCVQKPSDMCTILVVTDEQLLSASNKSTRASAAAAKPVAAAKAKGENSGCSCERWSKQCVQSWKDHTVLQPHNYEFTGILTPCPL